jgi:hypothetical protein
LAHIIAKNNQIATQNDYIILKPYKSLLHHSFQKQAQNAQDATESNQAHMQTHFPTLA